MTAHVLIDCGCGACDRRFRVRPYAQPVCPRCASRDAEPLGVVHVNPGPRPPVVAMASAATAAAYAGSAGTVSPNAQAGLPLLQGA